MAHIFRAGSLGPTRFCSGKLEVIEGSGPQSTSCRVGGLHTLCRRNNESGYDHCMVINDAGWLPWPDFWFWPTA